MSESLKTNTQQIENLINTEGPAINGAELLAGNDEALRLIGSTSVPGHEGVSGRIVGVQNDPEHGVIAAVTWKDEKDGQAVDAVRAFKVDELVEHNRETERQATQNVAEEVGATALREVKVEEVKVEEVKVDKTESLTDQAHKTSEEERKKEKIESIRNIADYFQYATEASRSKSFAPNIDDGIIRGCYSSINKLDRADVGYKLMLTAIAAGSTQTREGSFHASDMFFSTLNDLMKQAGQTEAGKSSREEILNLSSRLGNMANSKFRDGIDTLLEESRRVMFDCANAATDSDKPRNVRLALAAGYLFTGALAGDKAGGTPFVGESILAVLGKAMAE